MIISRLTNDVEALDQLVTDGVSTLVQSTLTLVGTAILLFILDWRLALATLVGDPGDERRHGALPPRTRRARTGPCASASGSSPRRSPRTSPACASSRRSPASRPTSATSARSASATAQSNQQTVVLSGLYFPFVDLLSTVALAIVLGYGGHLYFQGAVEIGTLFAFMLYVQNFFDPVQQLSQLYGTFLSATAALDKINDLLDEEPRGRRRARRARPRPPRRATSRFEGVRFTYGRGDEVLHGIDLDVPAGTTVALVGHTGAGQVDDREAARPLLRPDARADHARRRRPAPRHAGVAAPPARRRPAGGVPVRRHRAREHRVRAARTRPTSRSSPPRRRSAPTTSSAELEDGYDTELGERGSRLSLGQRQLVAFARALLADPRILVLDEATSSVDIGTERRIEVALRKLLAGRTAFIIAHRLSTIRDADLIVVLEHGRIVEQGSHDELLARRGLYTSLYGDWAADVA